jgi:hypothetical protein
MSFWQWLGTFTWWQWCSLGSGLAFMVWLNFLPHSEAPQGPATPDDVRRIVREELSRREVEP